MHLVGRVYTPHCPPSLHPMRWSCRGVLQVNIRLCFEEMWAKESAKRSSTSDQRRALKHELARKMKRAADFVRPDMDWPEAKQLMLDNGFSILNDMDARDCEHVCTLPAVLHASAWTPRLFPFL